MSEASLEALGEGRFRLSGVLDAVTAPSLLRQSEERFAGVGQLWIDLSGVRESDSTGLALVIEWLRGARQRGCTVRLANVPEQIGALARISEVEDLLLAHGENGAEAQAAHSSAASKSSSPSTSSSVSGGGLPS